MNLQEWLQAYLYGKGEIIEKEGLFYLNGSKYFLCRDFSIPCEKVTIITTNTKENVHRLVQGWKKAVQSHLRVFFVNLNTNEKWHLNPGLHDRITEPAALESGLLSIASTTGFMR